MLRYDCLIPFSFRNFLFKFEESSEEGFSKGSEGLEEYRMIVSNVSVLEELRALKQELQDSL